MRDFLATAISLGIILGSIWGSIIALTLVVDKLSEYAPSGLLYFSAGVVFASYHKKAGPAFMEFCNVVWEKVHSLVAWR